MSTLVAVICGACNGSGDGPDGFCGWCLAQGHEYVNRAFDGGVPVGYKEWIPRTLPDGPCPTLLSHARTDARPQ